MQHLVQSLTFDILPLIYPVSIPLTSHAKAPVFNPRWPCHLFPSASPISVGSFVYFVTGQGLTPISFLPE
jgi:hypothetical protein